MSTSKNPLADFAPKLVEITEKVLFGDVWERPQLSKRDRSLITCAALVALGKTEQMNFHFPRAIENKKRKTSVACDQTKLHSDHFTTPR